MTAPLGGVWIKRGNPWLMTRNMSVVNPMTFLDRHQPIHKFHGIGSAQGIFSVKKFKSIA